MKYSVNTLRHAGLEAKWGKTSNGAPIILARWPQAPNKHQRETWWAVDNKMWQDMVSNGPLSAFQNHTLLGDIFSVPLVDAINAQWSKACRSQNEIAGI